MYLNTYFQTNVTKLNKKFPFCKISKKKNDTEVCAGFKESTLTTRSEITVQKNHLRPQNEQRVLQTDAAAPTDPPIPASLNHTNTQTRSRQPTGEFWEILQENRYTLPGKVVYERKAAGLNVKQRKQVISGLLFFH